MCVVTSALQRRGRSDFLESCHCREVVRQPAEAPQSPRIWPLFAKNSYT